MSLIRTTETNPFQPILDEIAKHGTNIAPLPVTSAYEYDYRRMVGRWTVDVDVRIPNLVSFDLCSPGTTLGEAVRRALYKTKRELPRCRS